MKTADLMWLAGYLEGEGCFCVSSYGPGKKSLRVTISVCSVDKDVIDRAARIMGCTQKSCTRVTVTGKRVYDTRISEQKKVAALMRLLLPLMGKRRRKKIREALTVISNLPGCPHGERNGHSKLTVQRVINLRRMAELNPPRGWQSAMAKRCGVSQASVWYAINGKTWCRVHDREPN